MFATSPMDNSPLDTGSWSQIFPKGVAYREKLGDRNQPGAQVPSGSQSQAYCVVPRAWGCAQIELFFHHLTFQPSGNPLPTRRRVALSVAPALVQTP